MIAAHQTMVDVPVAIRASDALDHEFGTWAHPEVTRRAPVLRRLGFMDAPADAVAFRDLIAASRDFLRSQHNRALWVFPQGRFSHRNEPVSLQSGVRMLLRACPEIPVLLAGVDYSLFRVGRPHCVLELHRDRGSGAGLPERLTAAIAASGVRAAAELPHLVTPTFRTKDRSRSPIGGRHGRR